ncbi:uncharacterized protein PHACADRAFT_31594 [Phanerochaete carnosa HHB-10118-sp]|uniref:Uncharacterized protein n=1 Tax=Phanerochaete carnosa (strain HHB-10118-sp) TaxID=650164 RepID=K5UPR0_PHACS|nr:uncharacterized protein PHACADRAFT_31594 [Phanerochaete carnosa HHB-10118-sp]EKM51781.1 hypothetical protein PHACADRAFT_31594 [Phanerochaete carnosa HHB-10118-sp]
MGTPIVRGRAPYGESLSGWDDQIRMLTDWCLLTSVKDDHNPDEPYRALLGDPKALRDKSGELGELRRRSGVHVDDDGRLSVLCHGLQTPRPSVSRSLSLLIPSITQLSRADIKHFSTIAATRSSHAIATRAARQRAMELFSSLAILPDALTEKELWALLLEATGHMEPERSPVIAQASPDIFVLAMRNGKVKASPDRTGLVFEAEGRMTTSDHESLIDYLTDKLNGANDNFLSLVILTFVFWFGSGGTNSSLSAVTKALDKMITVAKAIDGRTHRGISSRERRDLLWISELYRKSYPLTVFHGARFRRLLHTLGHAFRKDLLVGPQDKIHSHLHDALVAAHKERPQCEVDPLCPWTSHNCTRIWGTCPLLSKRRNSVLGPSSPVSPGYPEFYFLRSREHTESSIGSSGSLSPPPPIYLPMLPRSFSRRERRATSSATALIESPVSEGRPSLDTQYSAPSEASHNETRTVRPRIGFADVVRRLGGQARVLSPPPTQTDAARPAEANQGHGSSGAQAVVREAASRDRAFSDPTPGAGYPPASSILLSPQTHSPETTEVGSSTTNVPVVADTSPSQTQPSPPLDVDPSGTRSEASDAATVNVAASRSSPRYAASLFEGHGEAEQDGEGNFDRVVEVGAVRNKANGAVQEQRSDHMGDVGD